MMITKIMKVLFLFKNISLNEGTKNEQKFLKYTYKHLSIDSLILKDLGYFNFENFKEIEDKNSFFIGNEKIPVKIVLTKLPEAVVDKRAKVIQERERRNKKPSTRAREFLSISGYVTNLWGFSSSEIIKLYKMRW